MKTLFYNKMWCFGLIFCLALTTGFLASCDSPTLPTNTSPVFSSNLPSAASIQVGTSLRLSVVATDKDSDTLTYTWKEATVGANLTTVGTNSSSYIFSKESVGSWMVKVIVEDGRGGSVESVFCKVDVTTTPTFTAILEDFGGPFTAPADVSFDVNANYSVGSISSVGIYTGEIKMGDASLVSGTLWRYSAHAVLEGTYSVRAKATASDSTVKESAERVLTVTKAAATYSVTYSGNGETGGSIPTDTNSYASGATATAKGNEGNLVKTGYSFDGWNTKADGSGTTYQAGSTFTIGSTGMTLYARWTAIPTYNVIYNANGSTSGSIPTDNNSYLQGAIATVLGNTGNLSRSGYTFAGWNTKADGSDTTYQAGSTFTIGSANMTLYAKWTAIPTYNVIYNANGATSGSVPSDTNSYSAGATATAKVNEGSLAKTGYTFDGWNTKADGSGTTYQAGSTFTIGSVNMTLYAKWHPFNTNIKWLEQTTLGVKKWAKIAMSSDGQKIVACENFGNLYISNNAGISWIQKDILGQKGSINDLAVSSDCSTLAVCIGQSVLISTDGGETWVNTLTTNSGYGNLITMSANGIHIIAANKSGYIYISNNSGFTWSQNLSLQAKPYTGIDCSSNGLNIYAATYDGELLSSQNGGATWTDMIVPLPIYALANWVSIATDSDGKKIAIMSAGNPRSYEGCIMYSADAGTTWPFNYHAGMGRHIYMSKNGNRLLCLTADQPGTSYYLSEIIGQGNPLGIKSYYPSLPSDLSLSDDGVIVATCLYNGYIYVGQ